jgi:hypothetical protein
MPSRKSQLWTPEEDDQIRALVAKGASAFRAGAALKRSQFSVYERARKIGAPFPTISEIRKRTTSATDKALWGHRAPRPIGSD